MHPEHESTVPRIGHPESKEKLKLLEDEINAEVLEREDEVRSLILALVAGEHALLLGPPGTAKSQLARALCSRIEAASFFYVCLNRASMPDEVFGPAKLSALREDRFERNTKGMLPEAEVAFIDEVFKSNSAVLNGMLPILNEGVYKNGKEETAVPLQMAVCASNEMPSDREELSALYDRLLVRHVVRPVRDDTSFSAILLGHARKLEHPVSVSLAEIEAARRAAAEVDLSPVVGQVAEIRRELSEKGIEPSVRRFHKGASLVKANAYLEGRIEATDEDLTPLMHVLWDEEEQIPVVRDAILSRANPYLRGSQDLLDEASEIRDAALAADELEAASVGSEANRKLRSISQKLLDLRLKAKGAGRSAEAIDKTLTEVKAMRKEVVSKCLGVDDI